MLLKVQYQRLKKNKIMLHANEIPPKSMNKKSEIH